MIRKFLNFTQATTNQVAVIEAYAMQYPSQWRQAIANTLLLALGLPLLFAPAVAANTSYDGRNPASIQDAPTGVQSGLQMTPESGVCYRIAAEEAEEGMYVREEPTIYSEAIAILDYGQVVTVIPSESEDYVAISAPIQGYIFGDWLAPC